MSGIHLCTSRLRCHLCQASLPCRGALGLQPVPRARSKSPTTTRAIAPRLSRELIESRPRNLWRYRELLPIEGEPRTGLHSGFTPLVRADRLAARARRPRAVRQRRLGEPSDLLLQGPGGLGRGDARRGARLHHVRVRLDRQPGRQRRRACRAARARLLGLHPGRPRARQGRRRQRLPAADRRGPRQLRRREPAVHAGRGPVRLGLRQHQPARLLRRRGEDLRASRSPSSSAGAFRATSSRRSPAARCCRAS